MPLESLDLTNFQNHRKLYIEFDPKITVFVGRTDAGKSAVLRALRWVCQNFPAGQEFIRDGSKFCRVLLIAEGQKVLRKVGKSNEYRLNGKKYKAFGRTVPPDITSLLNLRDENFQEQLDSPFWLALTPGQVGKELNAIINLGTIDSVLEHLNGSTRRANQNVKLIRERLAEAKEKKKELSWVPEMSRRLEGLQQLRQAAAATAENRANLAILLQAATRCQRKAKESQQAAARGLPAIAAGQRLLDKQREREELQELIQEIQNKEERLCQLQSDLKAAKRKLKKATIGQQCPLCHQVMS